CTGAPPSTTGFPGGVGRSVASGAAHPGAPMSLDSLRRDLLATVLEHGHRRLDEPVELASGQMNHDFVDGKAALADGDALADACRAMVALAEAHGVEFDTAGGLTMGADQFAHGI